MDMFTSLVAQVAHFISIPFTGLFENLNLRYFMKNTNFRNSNYFWLPEHLKRFDLYEKKKWETVFEDANDNSSNVPIGRYRHETAVYHDFLVVIGGGEQLRLG